MDKQYYKEYYHLERKHWWFRARLEILEDLLTKQALHGLPARPRILNAGVATGATTTMLEKHGTVTSLEYDKDCCDFLRETVKMPVVNASLTELPFEDAAFDLVCAFDVIEHIEDDALAVREIHRVLAPGGVVFLTVPAYQFLWSKHDEVNHHFRRYTADQLDRVLQQAAFRRERTSYFNSLLFPPIALARTVSNLRPEKETEEGTSGSDFDAYQTGDFVNSIFYKVFRLERKLLGKRGRFPFGVSLFTIGRKK